MVDRERIRKSETAPNIEGDYIAYWVQSSPRIEYNHTLEYAKEMCEKYNKPIFIFSILNPDYPDARKRAYEFFLGGLKDFKESLKNINLDYSIFLGNPEDIAVELSKNAVLMVTDKGYLNYNIELNQNVKIKAHTNFVEIESNLVVPVEEASDHEEYGAYTIRKKIQSKISKFVKDPRDEFLEKNHILSSYNKNYRKIKLEEFDLENSNMYKNFINSIEDDNYYPLEIIPGESVAKNILDIFIKEKLHLYSAFSNHPFENVHSGLSPYLHYGQISPVYIFQKINEVADKFKSVEEKESLEGFLEELIVRRELAFNFCYFNKEYNNFNKILHDWVYKTLEDHEADTRKYIYNLKDLENWKTHDNYWNEVQKELVTKGTMNSYMRMYWGKKILEWSENAETAFNTAIYLNNRYFLDGRDPNSFTGVAWCFGKHDRPWGEREIFGKVRYMNETGIIRKSKLKML
ncbi:MAG: deoxyribodipyrimidine photo-lyase [Fusobacteriaceae bacterium]